jgi:hypothetical protein
MKIDSEVKWSEVKWKTGESRLRQWSRSLQPQVLHLKADLLYCGPFFYLCATALVRPKVQNNHLESGHNGRRRWRGIMAVFYLQKATLLKHIMLDFHTQFLNFSSICFKNKVGTVPRCVLEEQLKMPLRVRATSCFWTHLTFLRIYLYGDFNHNEVHKLLLDCQSL